MSSQLGHRGGGVIPKKQAACYRIPDIPDDVGVAGHAGKALPVLNLQFPLCSVENAFLERDGEADSSTQDLRVVGIIIYAAAEHIRVKSQSIEDPFRQAQLVIAAVRGGNR